MVAYSGVTASFGCISVLKLALIIRNPDLTTLGEQVLPEGVINGDGQAAAMYIREKSAHDSLNGKLGSKVIVRYSTRLAERIRSIEHSELAAELFRTTRRASRTSISRAKDFLLHQTLVASKATDGWPCVVTNIETQEYENFTFSVIEKAIELRRPNLVGDDSVFVFDLADDTDVVAIDGVTVIIALSASVVVKANTAPSPASALLVQLKQMISKYFESYRVKSALEDYKELHRRLKEQFLKLAEAEQHKHESAQAMSDMIRTAQISISTGTRNDEMLAVAERLSLGESSVSHGLRSGPVGVSDTASVITVSVADSAAAAEASRRFIDAVAYQERNIQRDLRQLRQTHDSAFVAIQKAHTEVLQSADNVVSQASLRIIAAAMVITGVSRKLENATTRAERYLTEALGRLVCARQKLAAALVARELVHKNRLKNFPYGPLLDRISTVSTGIVVRVVVDQVQGHARVGTISGAIAGKEATEVKRLWREIQKTRGYQRMARTDRLDPKLMSH
eukprot:SAG31_NODE_1683_length_7534_cov_16.225824_2_plen_509_part_00